MKRISLITLVFVIALLLCETKSYSQFKLENWKTYSSLLDVTTASVDSRGRIWAGANGGVFVYDPAIDSVTQEFRNINALLSLQTTVVRYNPFNKSVYIGSFDGYLDISTEDFNWIHITDIISSQFTKKKINDIVFRDSIAYIGGDFGLAIFNTKQNVFITTITGFEDNSSSSNTVNRLLLEDGRIWVTTDKGVAMADVNSSLLIKKNWKTFTLGTTGAGGAIFSQGNEIYAVMTGPDITDAIYKLDNDTFGLVFHAGDAAEKIKSLGLYKDQVMFTSNYGLFLLDHSRIFGKENLYFNDCIPLGDSADTYVGLLDTSGIAIIQKDTLLRHIIPNCPYSNYFKRMAVDSRGNVWAVADQNSKTPVMKLENGLWKNFTTEKYNDNGARDFHLVSVTGDNKAVVSRWGRGFIIIDDNNAKANISLYDNTNSPATCAVISDKNWIVMGESRMDSKGNLWIVNYGAAQSCAGPVLIAQTPDNRFYSFDNCYDKDNRGYMYLAIDDNGTKWLGSFGETGLYYFNDNGTFDDPGDDVCGILTTSNSNIPSNSQTVVTVDKTGVVGIGSLTGMAFIPFPSSALRNTKISVQKPIIRILQSTPINDIMVDALNNKWIATNNGVWVISPDWMDSLAYINTQNSPSLISDEITSLATDPANGKIYMGSKYGMSEVTSLSIQSKQAFDIKCYPQPFNTNTDDYLTIDGLAPDANVNILTINGEPVKALSTTGRKLIWDGNDDKGNKVASGIYMIVASSASTGGTAVAKFAVVRK